MAMALTIQPARAEDARAVGNLAQQFAGYLRSLGDHTDSQLTAESYLRDGFGSQPAFGGLVAEAGGEVIGYLLYHFGHDSDAAALSLHIADLYVDSETRRRGAGKASIAREAGAREMIWSVYHANKLATTFYEKLGAQRIADVFFMKLRADAL